jgi:DNA-binding transcriptional LysR family regulator
LVRHQCIRHRFASGAIPTWEFERNGEVVRVVPTGRLVTNAMEAQLQAAVEGHGIVAMFEEWLAPLLASGALEPVLPDWWQRFSGPFLYYPSRRLVSGPLRAFIDFIRRTPPR